MSATSKWQSKKALQQIEDSRFQDRNRRARLNARVGMSKSHPWAFQLTPEELDQAEADVLNGAPPAPCHSGQPLGDPRGPLQGRPARQALPTAPE